MARVGKKGLTCELIDTKDLPDGELEYWRKEALVTSLWRHQQIRQHFGASQLDLGKKVPALLVYEEGEKVPALVYPQTKKRGQEKTDYPIEAFLEELIDSPGAEIVPTSSLVVDQLIYELYGLTDEEIRIVEEATA